MLLPGAFYFLRETQAPPVDAAAQHGVPIALATDCNPGTSPLTSLLLALNMAATLFRLTVDECLAGVHPQGGARARARRARSARSKPANGPISRSGTSSGRPSWSTASASTRSTPASGEANDRSILRPARSPLADWRAIYRGAPASRSIPAVARAVAASAAAVARILARGEPVYGINTGFGKLASVRIDDADLATLQRNIVLSPCRRRRRAVAGRRSSG